MSSVTNKEARASALQTLLGLKVSKGANENVARQLNRLMANIKGVGLIEETEIGGTEGNYLIIDGGSWDKTRRELGLEVQPSFVLWEESDFFRFLQTYMEEAGKKAMAQPTRKAPGTKRG
jgi:hypothetical protein